MTVPTLVTIAPRGKCFRVLRMDRVCGGKVLPVLIPGSWVMRADADKAASGVDERLSPTVVLLDDVKRSGESAS